MRILLVEHDATARHVTTAICVSLGHEVAAVESVDQAIDVLERRGTDLLFTDLVLPKKGGLELVRWVRGLERDAHLYILLLIDKEQLPAMDTAFSAGADDFVLKGASRVELAARFRVAERVVDVEHKMRARALEYERALRRLDISAVMRGRVDLADNEVPSASRGPELLERVRAWQIIESTLRAALVENAHLPFVVGAKRPWTESALASRVALTDIEHKIQIDLFLVAERPSAHAVAASVLGDPETVDEAVTIDTMLELANGAMGALKKSFGAEDYKLTAGIPRHLPALPKSQMLAAARDRRTLTLVAGHVTVTVLVGVHEKVHQRVRAKALAASMVLAENVVTATGALLLRAGTRLTESDIEHLQTIDPNMVVELADPGE